MEVCLLAAVQEHSLTNDLARTNKQVGKWAVVHEHSVKVVLTSYI